MNDAIDALVDGVALLSLDAGNTIIFLDHPRIGRWLAEQGFAASDAALREAEGVAKRRQEEDGWATVEWAGRDEPGARGWGGVLGTTMIGAGVPAAALPDLLPRLWREHLRYNLYSEVPAGLGPALEALRARGVPVVVVSNSEGVLERWLERLGILHLFDAVFDSAKVGVEKPDRRIFDAVLAQFPVAPAQVLHLGDTYATDVVGAEGAGMRAALIDPFGHYAGAHPCVPRVAGVVEVARAIAGRV